MKRYNDKDYNEVAAEAQCRKCGHTGLECWVDTTDGFQVFMICPQCRHKEEV